MPTTPTAPTAVPDFPELSDRATYNARAYAWAVHMDDVYPAEMLALANNTYNNAVEGAASAVTATTQAGIAATQVGLAEAQVSLAEDAASAAALTAGAAAWVNGGTYALNASAISGVDFQTYRKKTASSVTTTDPSADAANWVKLGGESIANLHAVALSF